MEEQEDLQTPYEPPDLECHGTVEEITKGLGDGTKDGISGSVLV